MCLQRDRDSSVKSVPQHPGDGEIWAPEYLKPSWVCLPNDRPVLAILQPGETSVETLDAVCKVGLAGVSTPLGSVWPGQEFRHKLFPTRN